MTDVDEAFANNAAGIQEKDREVMDDRHPAFTEYRVTMHDPDSGEDFTLDSCYTKDGAYIGDSKTARHLCEEMAIVPELRTPDSKTTSVGFSENDAKWYGWSHRAIAGFKAGDVVKKGDVVAAKLPIGYEIKDDQDAKRVAAIFAEEVS